MCEWRSAFSMLTTAVIVKSYQIVVGAETHVTHRNDDRIEDTGNRLKLIAFSINSNWTACKSREEKWIASVWFCYRENLRFSEKKIDGSEIVYILFATSMMNFIGVWAESIGGTKTCCNGFGSLFLRRINTPIKKKRSVEGSNPPNKKV